MRGDEERVVDALCAWLVERGWTIQREVDYVGVVVGVVAERHNECLYAEAKGCTTALEGSGYPLWSIAAPDVHRVG